MAKILSKSRYVQFCQCPKSLWLQMYKPEVQVEDESAETRIKTGIEVGNLAKSYFGEFIDTTTHNEDGTLNIGQMLVKTNDALAKGANIICEAAFNYDGCYCAVDILKHEGDNEYTIYEVKSTTAVKPEHIYDVAYQKYVLQSCGLEIAGTHILCLNHDYVLDGELDIQVFFANYDIKDQVQEIFSEIEININEAKALLASTNEPEITIGKHCQKADVCPFWQYCTRNLPQPNVFQIGEGMRYTSQLKLVEEGIVSFRQLYDAQCLKDKYAKVVVSELFDKQYLDKDAIRAFLETVRYPLYHLDFETMQPAVPFIQGTRPYQQIPFQYSLHIQHEACGPVEHKEFLAESGEDPTRAIAEALVRDIPMDVCSMAYNTAFEKTRLSELANMYPDLAYHLENIRDNMVDLMIPFANMDYYTKEMQGSYSIKYVLPALYPNDPELDYHKLEDVHNGGEAMAIFPLIRFMKPEEQQRVRTNLLKYCQLDTYAMVKVLNKLYEVTR